MESNSVCEHTSDSQNRTAARRESNLLILSMITDRIERHKVLLPINHSCYNSRKQMSAVETMSKLKDYSTLEILQLI